MKRTQVGARFAVVVGDLLSADGGVVVFVGCGGFGFDEADFAVELGPLFGVAVLGQQVVDEVEEWPGF